MAVETREQGRSTVETEEWADQSKQKVRSQQVGLMEELGCPPPATRPPCPTPPHRQVAAMQGAAARQEVSAIVEAATCMHLAPATVVKITAMNTVEAKNQIVNTCTQKQVIQNKYVIFTCLHSDSHLAGTGASLLLCIQLTLQVCINRPMLVAVVTLLH